MAKELLEKLKDEKTEKEKKQFADRIVLTDADLEEVWGGRPPKVDPKK